MIERPEILGLVHAAGVAVAGAGLGVASAAGLRRTVRRLADARRPGRRLAADFALRAVVTLAPIPLLAAGRPVAVLAGLLAFVLVRRLAIHRLASHRPPTHRLPTRRLPTRRPTRRPGREHPA